MLQDSAKLSNEHSTRKQKMQQNSMQSIAANLNLNKLHKVHTTVLSSNKYRQHYSCVNLFSVRCALLRAEASFCYFTVMVRLLPGFTRVRVCLRVLVHYYWRRIFISICTGAKAHDIRSTFLGSC